MKCFYHSADLDGHCSGAIIKQMYPDCEMIGINYGDSLPWDILTDVRETVWMVDFALQPFDLMIKLARSCRLHWIDHHVSAYNEAMKRNFECDLWFVDCKNAACELVWEYVMDKPLPDSVHLLGRHDVFDHTDPKTLPFQFGMRMIKDTRPDNFVLWKSLFSSSVGNSKVNDIIEKGRIILEYTNSENEKHARACSFETFFDGYSCIAVNKALANSMIFDSVYDDKKHDLMIVFGFRKGKWLVSLYTKKDDIDVSKIAQRYGGGGHKKAAGFPCKELPFYLFNE